MPRLAQTISSGLVYTQVACVWASQVVHWQETQETQVQPLLWKIPWRREWQPIPVFLPGESHGQRSLEGFSPYGRKESDTKPLSTQHMEISVCNQVLELVRHQLEMQNHELQPRSTESKSAL